MFKKFTQMSLAFEYLSFEYNIAIVKWKLFSSDSFWRDFSLFYVISHGIVGLWVAFATFWLSIIFLWVKTNIMRDYCYLGVSNIIFTNFFSVFSFIFCPFSPQSKAWNGGENPFDIKNQNFSDISTIFPIILNLVWAIFSKHFRLKNYQRFWGPMDPVRAN